MKTLSTTLLLLLLNIMSFGQPLTFSPPSGSQVIGSNGGSFQLTINKSFAGGITIYNFPVGLSSSSTTDLTPTITVAANNGPGRSLSFNVYGNGVTYTYTVSQLGINCTSLTGTNPTSITGNLNPCLNQTITYSLPTLSAGMWYSVKFGNNDGYFYDFTTLGGNFNANFTFTGSFSIELRRKTNCYQDPIAYIWGNVNANPSTPIISGMNTFTTGSPINFTSTLQSGETNTWTFNSNTFTGTSFTTTLGVGSYSVSVQNFNGSCASSSVSQSFTVKSRQTIAGISSLLSGYTYPVSNISLANVTASSGLPVSVVSYDPSVLSISGNFIYFLKAGVTTITASQAGNSQYFAAPALVYNVSVAQGASVISVTSSIPSVVTLIGAGTSITLSGVSSSGTPLQYTLSGGGSVSGNVITLSKAGTFTLTVSNLANDKYEASSLSFVINVVTVAGISNTTTPGPTNLSSFENSESVSFKVFPNPTTGTFSFVSEFANMEYIITNTEGNLVYKNTAIKGTNTIEVKLPKGIYFFNLGVQKQKLVVD